MKIAVIQITSVEDPQKNLTKVEKYLKLAKKNQVTSVFLPECFYSLSGGRGPTTFLATSAKNDQALQTIKDLAKKYSLYLLGGSMATKVRGKIFNRCYNINPQGQLIGTYDKIHLFKCTLPGQVINEDRIYSPGNRSHLMKVKNFKIGLSICFDLRFPDLYQKYFKQGAHVLSVSSAFTKKTGKDHWIPLLQARAIENQSYVVAANQWGKHSPYLESYGHSVIIDPWGKILAQKKSGEGIIYATLNKNQVKHVRKQIALH